jgi:ribose transport system substrate-binding protein
MPRRAFRLTLFIALLTVSFSGCISETGDSADSATNSNGKEKPAEARGTIGVSLLTLDNPFFKVIGDNITESAKEFGYETTVLSADKDPATQNDQIKNFIVQKVSAIVLSPCESRSVVPAIQEANQAGIPVITVDIPCNETGVEILTQIATDNYGGGKKAAEAMIEALGSDGGQVAILHFKQAESCRLRVKGFREVIEAHNAKGEGTIEIVGEYPSGGAKDQGFKATEDALQTDPDLDGIFAINDPAALGARAALEKAERQDDVVIVGFDGQPEGKQAIKDGKIYADPIQYPDKMGQKVVEAIVAHYKGKEVPKEQLIPTSLYRQADGEADPDLK